MKNSTKIARQLIVLALATLFLINSLAVSSYAVRRPLKEKTRVASPKIKPSSHTSSQPVRQTTAQAGEAYSKLPLSFEVNRGQTDSQVKFLARGGDYTLFLTATETVFTLRKDARREKSVSRDESRRSGNSILSSHSSSSTSTLRMKLVGAEPEAQITGEDQLPGRINYFTGRDAGKWRTDVPSYARVRYQRIYPGVDMIYYGNQRELEYDFVVAPGASPGVIELAFTGARKARIAQNGDLLLRTAVGEIRQHKPVAYQETGGTRQSVSARYVIRDGQIGFQVGRYDTSKPLVIDPILSYSTYLGGAGSYEVAFGVAVDADGNAYVTGTTASADYPLTPGTFQSTTGGNNSEGDAFVTKLNATGSALVYSTYLGGSARDFAWDIAVDADGNAYVTGDTSSYDFPTTAGAFQIAHAAGTEVDGFVVKLDPAGSGLVYSTYLGGSGNEDSRGIAVNGLGEAYITGETPSTDFPTTPGAYRTVIGSDNSNHDVFVTKLNATGTTLDYSTFLGASSASGKDIALDSAGNAYVVGVTYYVPSLFTFPVTANAHQSAAGAEGFDGFISELSATGTDLLYSSYLGGSMEESVVGVAVDVSNNVYVTGYTGSADFPVTPGCAQAVNGGSYDTFISKFDLASSPTAALIYSTYLGGSNLEDPHGIAVDSAGNAYVAGYTQSNDYPETESLGATGFLNAFVAKLNAAGSQFLDSARFGDTYTYGYNLALDSAGNAYVVGQTTSSSFATTPGVFQTALAGGGSDAFVTKIDFTARQADLALAFRPGPLQVTPGSPDIYVLDISNNGPHVANAVILTDELPAGVSFTSAFPIEGASGTCTAQGNTVTCELGNLDPNSSAAVGIAVNVTAASGATLENVASVSSSTADPDTQNNSASFTTEVLALADLSIDAAVQPQNFVANGANITYTVNATNNGPNTASAATVSGTLPSAVTFNNIVNDYGTCTTGPDGNGNVHFDCSLGDSDPGITKTITFTGVANGAPYTQLPFSATVSSATQDPADYNNNAATGVQIPSPPLPRPTPGGANEAQLAYGKFDPTGVQGDIFRQRADAAGLLNLTNDPASYSNFVWSPDGSRIAFGRFDPTNFSIKLFVMDADGTHQTQLTNSPTEQAPVFVWSPDGTRLAFTAYDLTTNTGTIHTINADGTDRRALTSSTGDDSQPAWSPDGTRISFSRSFFDPQTERSTASIFVMNADGSNQIQFGQPAGTVDYNPTWSPDSAQIAWARYPNDGQHGPDLFLALRDGTNMRNLTNDHSIGFDAPLWSPDGSKLSFLSSPDNSFNRLSVINADGTGRTVISGSVESISANKGWSPNGAKLVFTVSYGEVYNGLYMVNADGTGLTHIGDDIEGNNNPAWSPDSSKLAFTSARNSQGSIDIVNANGTSRVDLTDAPASYSLLKWRPVPQGNTPAGANVTVTSNGVTLNFSNVTTAGETTVTPIDPNSLSGVPGEYVINANSLAFEIHTTAVYTGPITIGFQVPSVNNPITFSALRVLHGEPPPVPNFVDRTVLAPDTPAPNFATRTIYARVTSLSPFVIAELRPNLLTALGPAQVWIGLKNSDDVGTKFDLLAEVFKNGTLIGSGQLDNVAGGSSGFNNAKLDAINLALTGTPSFGPGNTLSIRLSVRIAASSGHRSGTARLWFNDSAANSRFSATIGGVTNNYYLRKPNDSLVLTTTTGSTAKITIDVLVDRAVGGNPFKPFGTWSITF